VDNGDGEEMSPASVCGDPRWEFFLSRDKDGELKSDEEFPVAIPTPGHLIVVAGIRNWCAELSRSGR
jgi:hypothetical protein